MSLSRGPEAVPGPGRAVTCEPPGLTLRRPTSSCDTISGGNLLVVKFPGHFSHCISGPWSETRAAEISLCECTGPCVETGSGTFCSVNVPGRVWKHGPGRFGHLNVDPGAGTNRGGLVSRPGQPNDVRRVTSAECETTDPEAVPVVSSVSCPALGVCVASFVLPRCHGCASVSVRCASVSV